MPGKTVDGRFVLKKTGIMISFSNSGFQIETGMESRYLTKGFPGPTEVICELIERVRS